MKKRFEIIMAISLVVVFLSLLVGSEILFNEKYIDENVFVLSFVCTGFEQWESNFPYFLRKIRRWKISNRNQFLLKCFLELKMDGGCWLPYIDSIYKYHYDDFFLWLKDSPQYRERKNRIDALLLLHDDYLHTIKKSFLRNTVIHDMLNCKMQFSGDHPVRYIFNQV